MANIFEKQGVKHLEGIVNECSSLADVLRAFDYSISSSSYKVLKNTLNRHSIDYSHIPTGIGSNLGRKVGPKQPIEKYLVIGKVNGTNLKKRLISERLIDEKCAECGLENVWHGKYLSLHLDHINGNHNDNTLSNLRLLCPNCHAQTETYSGKSRKKRFYCFECNKEISSKSMGKCWTCANRNVRDRNKKFDISKEDLFKLVWEKPTIQIAREFGVSDKAVEKRCKKLMVEKPPRGYWSKNKVS